MYIVLHNFIKNQSILLIFICSFMIYVYAIEFLNNIAYMHIVRSGFLMIPDNN